MIKFEPSLAFCAGCIYFHPDRVKCRRFTGYRVGYDKNQQQYCIVKDDGTKKWIVG